MMSLVGTPTTAKRTRAMVETHLEKFFQYCVAISLRKSKLISFFPSSNIRIYLDRIGSPW